MDYKELFIEQQEDFLSTYKGKRTFVNESEYYTWFLNGLSDNKLLDHIIFCNDVLQLPPIYVFTKFYKELFNHEMTPNEKRSLGACWGYFFQFILKYKNAHTIWVGDKTTGIKNASYFVK